MTYYRIGPILVTSTIRPAKMGRGIKLQFHCMNIGLAMSDLVANLQYKPSPWTQTRVEATKASSWTRRETARPRKEQMNEADRALVGVGPSETCIGVASTLACRKPSPSAVACPCPSAKSNAHGTPASVSSRWRNRTVEVHRRWCNVPPPVRRWTSGSEHGLSDQPRRSRLKDRVGGGLINLWQLDLTLIKQCQVSSAQYLYTETVVWYSCRLPLCWSMWSESGRCGN